MVALRTADVLEVDALPPDETRPTTATKTWNLTPESIELPPEGAALDEIERAVIVYALTKHGGSIAAAARFRATNVRFFGSALHAQDTEGSDLDILVDTLPQTTLFDLGGLQVELERLLGVKVDVLTPFDLPL